jgi:aldehyde:ferredoxin oxidoreductase
MANGYAGKILKINLSTKEISAIDTARYEEFGGGVGMGAAIFWDLAVVPGDWDLQDAFDPRNVISLMTGPMAATGVPGGGRTSVCAIAPEIFPTPQFHRTSFGGRFATMLKLAGWDGVVVQGKAERPVWINIVNDKVTIEDAGRLWGVNTLETQGEITGIVGGRTRFGQQWYDIDDEMTTARPQIVCIGPVGESMSRVAALIHGSGVSARTGGFGGVFGSKNLKAVSVIGTGSVEVADPAGVVDARLWHTRNHSRATASPGASCCMPCLNPDRRRDSYYGGESMCADQYWYMPPQQGGGMAMGGGNTAEQMRGADIAIKWGLCTWATKFGGAMTMNVPGAAPPFKGRLPMEPGMGWYIKYLYELGVLGPGKKIESHPLPMDQWDSLNFREVFCDAIARKIGIGADLAEGILEAAKKWGRLEEDLNSGALRLPAWGASWHHSLPGVEWAYSYIFMTGDPMWHGFFSILTGGGGMMGGFGGPSKTAQELVESIAPKLVPFDDDPLMLSNCWKGEEAFKTGIYSPHKAKLLSWCRRFAGFYNESMSICEMLLPGFTGPSPELEHRYYRAVTGSPNTFADTMEIGRKIWNMERAIRVVAGRHRDQEKFAPFMHMKGATFPISTNKPIYQDGKWSFEDQADLYLDRKGVETFKTNFYKLEGWNVDTGWPTRTTLEGLGMKKVADLMAAKGKLGA